MPNFAKLAQDLLSADELALSQQSTKRTVTGLSDTALMSLIAQLEAAETKAKTQAPKTDTASGKSGADILHAALRRAHVERRRRGLRPDGTKATGAKDAGQPTAKPRQRTSSTEPKSAAATPTARRRPGTRKAAAKPDTRTTARRIAKAKPTKVAAAVEAPAAPDEADAKALKKAAKKAEMAEKKAAKKAARAAERTARKAAKLAEKASQKAERKTAKKAARKAEKAAKDEVKKDKKDKKSKKKS